MSQKYKDALEQLRPFESSEDSILRAHDAALGAMFQEIEDVNVGLIPEIFAATTVTELPDHERNWGLPDPCTGPLDTVPERQEAFQLRKRSSIAGLSRQFFIDLAAQIGHVITIDETFDGDTYTWNVNLPYTVSIAWFEMGTGKMGDPINRPSLQPLECLITRLKPRHTVINFTYTP